MILELKYSKTNTYLIKEQGPYILFDTGCAGSFADFSEEIRKVGVKLQDIGYLFISHFHSDHMGIAQEIADAGVKIVVLDVQKDYVHFEDIIVISIKESRKFLKNVGIDGEIIHTPGHSDDSISLCLDDGSFFVGDLNPLYEIDRHRGTLIWNSWEILLEQNPNKVHYGHGKSAVLDACAETETSSAETETSSDEALYNLVSKIMKYVDKKYDIRKIQKKTKADLTFIEDVMRMYLTHQNVSVQGILDRIEIKNK